METIKENKLILCGECTPIKKSNICIEKSCKKQSNYNNEGEKTALYCVTHKKEGMINVISKTCIEKNCKKQPSYNNEGEKKGMQLVAQNL